MTEHEVENYKADLAMMNRKSLFQEAIMVVKQAFDIAEYKAYKRKLRKQKLSTESNLTFSKK